MRHARGAQRGRQPCPGRLLLASTIVPAKVVSADDSDYLWAAVDPVD
jgi:hypothetical protein